MQKLYISRIHIYTQLDEALIDLFAIALARVYVKIDKLFMGLLAHPIYIGARLAKNPPPPLRRNHCRVSEEYTNPIHVD